MRSMALLALLIAGCTEPQNIQVSQTASSSSPDFEEIEASVNLSLVDLVGKTYDPRAEGLLISEDGQVACGWMTSEGRKPISFAAVDRDPQTIEGRKIILSAITDEDWGSDPMPSFQAVVDQICAKNGIVSPELSSR